MSSTNVIRVEKELEPLSQLTVRMQMHHYTWLVVTLLCAGRRWLHSAHTCLVLAIISSAVRIRVNSADGASARDIECLSESGKSQSIVSLIRTKAEQTSPEDRHIRSRGRLSRGKQIAVVPSKQDQNRRSQRGHRRINSGGADAT